MVYRYRKKKKATDPGSSFTFRYQTASNLNLEIVRYGCRKVYDCICLMGIAFRFERLRTQKEKPNQLIGYGRNKPYTPRTCLFKLINTRNAAVPSFANPPDEINDTKRTPGRILVWRCLHTVPDLSIWIQPADMALLKPTFPQGPQLASNASWIKYKYGTVQCCVVFIPDPRSGIFHPGSRIRICIKN